MRILAAFALLLALSACGREAGPTDSGTLKFEPSGEYVVTAATVGGSPHAFVKGSEVRLTLEDGRLGITAGCNHLFGDYSLAYSPADLVLTAGTIGGTEMGCAPALMAQDSWLARFFSEPVSVGTDPLTLTSGDTVLTLTPRTVVHPDQNLVGVAWVLDGVIDGGSVSSIPDGPEVVLTLEGTDVAGLTGLCNGFGADVTIADDKIRWMPHMRTLMACADDARMKLDNEVSAILTGTTAYTIKEGTLTLTNGERGLTFRSR
jgi:heat shock protein HslJ